MKMAAGKIQEDPFPKSLIRQLSDVITSLTEWRIGWRRPWSNVREQPINVEMLGNFLEAAGDPDFRSMRKDFAPGVKIGWKRRMLRTPAVYERMKEWRLKTSEGPAEDSEWQANYSTSMDRRQDLILRFEKDGALNMMKSMTFKEAKKRWGSRLKVAAIGAVEQIGKEWRFTHDATHGVRVNHYIKPRDKIRSPMGGDVKRTVADI